MKLIKNASNCRRLAIRFASFLEIRTSNEFIFKSTPLTDLSQTVGDSDGFRVTGNLSFVLASH